MSRIAEHAFGDQPAVYPDAPGWKERTTSRDAAKAIKGRAGTLRAAALAVLAGREMTADEIAESLGETVLAIRPRVSELYGRGQIVPTGDRRANESGQKAKVWRTA